MLIAYIFSGEDEIDEVPAPVEAVVDATPTPIGVPSSIVLEPVAVPIHSEDGDYIGNAFTRITVDYLELGADSMLSGDTSALVDEFSLRLARGDLFQENSTLLDIDLAEEALKALLEQKLGAGIVTNVIVEPTTHKHQD